MLLPCCAASRLNKRLKASFDLVTLKVDCEFGDVNDELKGIETNLRIVQSWMVDNKDLNERCFAVEG